jgi:histidine triad (HIT) family protein
MDVERISSHAPSGYICPFCLIVAGVENEHVWTRQQDVVYRDEQVTAFIAAGWWPNNPGHVLIVPNQHFENIFDLPLSYATAMHAAAQRIAVAFKRAYRCDGVSMRQHNEPAGNQDVWHYHLHIFPRYANDRLYELINQRRRTELEERVPYALRLAKTLEAIR